MRGRLRLKTVILFLIITVMLGYYGFKSSIPVHYVFVNKYYAQPCNLPVLDPFDSSIMKFFWKPEPIKCDDFPSIVFVDKNNVLHLNESAVSYFGLQGPSDILCSVESVYRNGNDETIGFNVPRNVELPAELYSDFNRVTCKSSGGKVLFQNILAGITPKPHVDERILEETEEPLSVLMLGIDSVSRSASIRSLPKTTEVLQALGAYDFHGMTKVGDNTIPNLIAILTGLKLWSDSETIGFDNNIFDRFPLLWRNFSAKNYVTMYSEDVPHMALFNHFLKGFNTPPTDHYMRPFWLALGKAKTIVHSTASFLKYLQDKGIKITKSPLCNQNTKNYMEIINYTKRFMQHYKTKRKFVFSYIIELAHRFVNFLNHADEDLKDFFLWMKDEGFLDRTVVIFFSDHGSRYDDIRNTFIGRIESRMPMLHILLPEHIKRQFPDVDRNMKTNTNRLTTHYDVYQTMVDILNKNFKNPSTQIYNGVKRGLSLFQEISSSRSCVDALVPADFCACYKATPVNITNNGLIQKIAGAIVDHLNSILKSEPNCKVLMLNKILSAQKMSQGLKHTDTQHNGYSLYRFFKPEHSRDSYSVTIETVPGHGTFDASCELEPNGRVSRIKNIDRTNAYGNQSSCISDTILKQFCYC